MLTLGPDAAPAYLHLLQAERDASRGGLGLERAAFTFNPEFAPAAVERVVARFAAVALRTVDAATGGCETLFLYRTAADTWTGVGSDSLPAGTFTEEEVAALALEGAPRPSCYRKVTFFQRS